MFDKIKKQMFSTTMLLEMLLETFIFMLLIFKNLID